MCSVRCDPMHCRVGWGKECYEVLGGGGCDGCGEGLVECACVRVCLRAFVHACISMRAYACVHKHACMHTYVCTNVQTYICM